MRHTFESELDVAVQRITNPSLPLNWTVVSTDLFFAIGRARVQGWSATYTVKKVGADLFEVIATSTSGTFADLYDFNYTAGEISNIAAIVQLGYGWGSYGRIPGQIFLCEYPFVNYWTTLP